MYSTAGSALSDQLSKRYASCEVVIYELSRTDGGAQLLQGRPHNAPICAASWALSLRLCEDECAPVYLEAVVHSKPGRNGGRQQVAAIWGPVASHPILGPACMTHCCLFWHPVHCDLQL